MKEKRQEVERDHERKLERMKAEHREVLARIQEQYEEEVLPESTMASQKMPLAICLLPQEQ